MFQTERIFRIAVISFCTLMATARAGEMVLAGTHPTSPSTAFPAIHVLKAYDGRIYMGYGDWNVYPAVTLVSYDPVTSTFRPEHSPGSDSIGSFRIIGSDLWVPSIDPVHFEEFADVSVRSGRVWRRYAPVGFLHVLDVTTLTGSDLWLVGAKLPNETPNSGAAVQRSTDGGYSWSDVTLTNSQSRYYYCFTLRGKLYVRDTVYDGLTATRISAFPYQLLYKPVNIGSGENEVIVGIAAMSPGIGTFTRQSLVRFDGTNWQTLKTNVVDFTVVGVNLYTLEYNPASGSNKLWTAAYGDTNSVTWSQLPLSNVPANAKAIEVLGDAIYIGDTAGRLWIGRLDGSPIVIGDARIVNELPDGFGRAIAVNDTFLAIGAPESSGGDIMSGEVTVWTRTNSASGSAAWTRPQVFTPPAPVFSGWFGKDVALENGTLVVLEAGADSTGMDRGVSARIHLYENTAQGWQRRQTLTNAYAQSLALSSNVLWVAASTILYRYDVSAGTNGISAALAEVFGTGAPSAVYQPSARVIADGKRAAFGNVGDFSRYGGPGQVNVYEREAGGWRKVVTILRTNLPPLPGLVYPPDAFGFSIALANDWLVVGAPRDDTVAWQAGAVHLYQRVAVGTNISYIARQKIVSPVVQQDAAFGSFLAFDGEFLVIGAPGQHSSGISREGRAFLYRLDGTNAVLVNSISPPAASQTEFGAAVALNGHTIIAGSRTSITNANPLTRVLFSSVLEVVGTGADVSLHGNVAPSRAVAGTPVEYSITVSNAGPSTATAVLLNFAKPTNGMVTAVSSSSGTCTNGLDSITCALPELAAGAVVTLQVSAEPSFASTCELMRSRITVTANEFDLNLRNNDLELAVNDHPPAVAMLSPTAGTTIRFGGTVELAATATTTNGVAQVSFYTNGVLFRTSTIAPYTAIWSNLPAGTHSITARALDSCGFARTSAPVALIVTSNARPHVAIVSPLDRTRFSDGSGIQITATASDADGSISSVRIYRAANVLIHQAIASPPYLFTWTNPPPGLSVLVALAIDNDGARSTSAPVLIMVGNEASGSNWVAYNDHGTGPATHPNATSWDIRGAFPGSSGALKNIATGAVLPVSVAITRVNPNNTTTVGAPPAAGTPAAEAFTGYVDFTGGSSAEVAVGANQSVTYTFTGLNPSRVYSLKMTAIRGEPSYTDRWTLMTLNGAQSFRAAHSAGALTHGIGTLSANQVAINTGFNLAGEIANWEDIVPAPNGTLAVISTQYTGPIPSGGMGVLAPYGYAPSVFRLEETTISLPLVSTAAVSQTVSPGATPTFTIDALGSRALVYQWFRDNEPITGATSAVLNLPPVAPLHAGRYSVRSSSTNGHVVSQPAVLTLLSMHRNWELELWGPVGQAYRVESRASLGTNNPWRPFTNFVFSGSSFLLADPAASNSSQQFYRAIATP